MITLLELTQVGLETILTAVKREKPRQNNMIKLEF
jgi:hypothetical protein